MVYNAIWRASSSYPYIYLYQVSMKSVNAIWRVSSSYPYIYFYQVSMKSDKALPRYGSGHKSAGRTDGQPDGRTTPKQYPSASGGGYILIPSFNEIRQSTSKIWLRTQKCL